MSIRKNMILSQAINGTILANRLLLAHNYFSRLRGLIGRAPLQAGEVLWIKPCQQVHTHFMGYALDIVFLDKELRVVEVVRGLRPWKISPWVRSAHSLLEFRAGGADNIQLGDVLTISG